MTVLQLYQDWAKGPLHPAGTKFDSNLSKTVWLWQPEAADELLVASTPPSQVVEGSKARGSQRVARRTLASTN